MTASRERTHRVGRAVLAMNVLGDTWVAELAKHPPDPWPKWDALAAYESFSSWLWVRIVNSPVENQYGERRADGQQLETFRRTLPPFEVFQAWHNREEHQGGLKQRAAALRLRETFEEGTGLTTKPEQWARPLAPGLGRHVATRPNRVFDPNDPQGPGLEPPKRRRT